MKVKIWASVGQMWYANVLSHPPSLSQRDLNTRCFRSFERTGDPGPSSAQQHEEWPSGRLVSLGGGTPLLLATVPPAGPTSAHKVLPG